MAYDVSYSLHAKAFIGKHHAKRNESMNEKTYR